jgi:hypothetical protein
MKSVKLKVSCTPPHPPLLLEMIPLKSFGVSQDFICQWEELRLDCSWANKCVPSIGLIGIASSNNEWHERGLLVANRSWILQNGSIALGCTLVVR